MNDELVRIGDAAKILKVSRSTAYALAQRGDLPGLVRVGGALRVSVLHLREWIDTQARHSTPAS